MMARRRGHEQGLTLIEVMVTISIMGVVATALYMLFGSMQHATRVSEEELQTQQLTRVSIERLSRMIRQATLPPGRRVMLDRAEPYRIVFYAQMDDDDLFERVRFDLDGDRLEMWVSKPDCATSPCDYGRWREASRSTFTEGVRNSQLHTGVCDGFDADQDVFTYYERGDAGRPEPLVAADQLLLRSSISSIGISLIVDVEDEGDGAGCRQLESVVTLRNWRGK